MSRQIRLRTSLEGLFKRLIALSCVVAGLVSVTHAQEQVHAARDNYEPQVLEITQLVQQGELEKALNLADMHLEKFPSSRIVHLIRGDILLAMSWQFQTDEVAQDSSQVDVVAGLKQQIKNRWRHYKLEHETAEKMVPASLVYMGRHRYVIVADMQAGRLYLYEKKSAPNGQERPVLVRDYYLSVGSAGYGKQSEGDNKTPIGVYSIYKHISPRELPDLYGAGAFPVDYPNRFDRSLKRTGYGIWLHGTPSNAYARSPWASEGCFVVSNEDLLDIQRFIDVKSRPPVILSDGIKWISTQELKRQQDDYFALLAGWQRDWESLNTQAYLEHYSKDNFNFGSSSFKTFSQRKKQVNKAKTFVQTDMQIESLFLYPGVKDMFVVNYKQRYLSNNYAGETAKQQYWQRDDKGRWKIIFEG